MNLLPHWVLTDKFPAFYDTDSKTAIEQTARVYGAMNSLITEHNEFVDKLNQHIKEYELSTEKDHELFKVSIRQEFQDFIDAVDLKVLDATKYMKDNLRESCQGLLDELAADARNALESVKETQAHVETELQAQDDAITQQNNVLSGAIQTMNTRLQTQDDTIAAAVMYLHENLENTVNAAVESMIQNGEITFGIAYHNESESLSFAARDINYGTDLSLEYVAADETIFIRES